MKDAVAQECRVAAGPDAPREAVCPECGGKVVLRRRGETWFYRHVSGPPTCPRRTRLEEW